jgi:phosphorylase/glycogen(starch) synthase
VHLIHVPIYLAPGDGLFDLPYEAVLRALDLTVFPSFYEPWGYTPQESLAVGVPTITTDMAGFGRWARDARLGAGDGVVVLEREEDARRGDESALPERLAGIVESFLAESRERASIEAACRASARLTSWSDLIRHYDAAFESARTAARLRAPDARPAPSAPAHKPVEVAPAQQGQRARLTPFRVAATLPEPLRGLERLARNLWWSWDAEAPDLYRDLAPARWARHGHNPVTFLRDVYTEDLARMAADEAYVERVRRVLARFEAYSSEPLATYRHEGAPALSAEHPVAYFSAEFGLHESLRVYSGGLGILAGDHLKSASDLGLPLVGVGLFYRMGYFTQSLTPAGEQLAGDRENDPRDLPLEPVLDARGEPLRIEIAFPSSTLWLCAWKAQVGRVPLYLLDANLPENRPEDRDVTRRLYGGDHETRLRQEIVLGRGGKRLLQRLGIHPACFHINEGHAAFLVLERVSRLVKEQGLTFDEAREFVRATTAFTTHTPVPAGHDRFGEDVMRRYFSDVAGWVGVPWERFWALGTSEEDRGSFNMTYLAMSFAGFVNGVSRLHGEVSRALLKPFWPRLLTAEVPVTSITNGVHLSSWTHPETRALLCPRGTRVRGSDFESAAARLSDEDLWDLRRKAKARLVETLEERLRAAFLARSDSAKLLSRTLHGLDRDAMWIGFARRFAPYKRAQLLLREPERLAQMLGRPGRPVRIVFAGKAHPADKHGQEILKAVVEATRSERLSGQVFFVEDYDIGIARSIVQGVDVWLNNPTRPLEASGTSGMKVAANGGLNVSIQDGWWIEAQELEPENGWSIGAGQVYPTQDLQDDLDGEILYRLLDETVIPLWFQREGGLPRAWLSRVRANLRTIPPVFDTDRMVGEYRDRAYVRLGAAWHALREGRFAPARARAERALRIRRGFDSVRIAAARIADLSDLREGQPIDVRVEAELGQLTTEDVCVEVVLGHSDDGRDLKNAVPIELAPRGLAASGARVFEGRYVPQRSGSYAWAIRVRARDGERDDLSTRDLVLWG